MSNKKKDNAYVIQEQGDLGLGLQKIDKKYIDKNGNVQIPKNDSTGFTRRVVK
jgi:hypothetical protein